MNRSLAVTAFALAALPVLPAHAVEQLIPAGAVINCTVAEPKISSKTDKIGDTVLCQVSHFEQYGRATFPYGSYLEGHFEDYKDPGHFVGKGFMELKFDKLIVGNDTMIPVSTRVIATPKYKVDDEGRILGNGHAKADIVEWAIPLLWPIDLINLPRRGPRPVLTAETKLTVKLLDDIGIPSRDEVAEAQPALVSRGQIAPAPIQQNYAQQPQQGYQQPQYQQQQPPQTIIYNYAPAMQQQQPQYQQPTPVVVQVQTPPPVQQAPPVIYNYPPAPVPYYVPYRPYGYYRPY